MQATITVDTSQFDQAAEVIQDFLASPGDTLASAVDATIMPDLSVLSTNIWNVRTGAYSTGWTSTQISSDSVEIDNEVEYAQPLETGWTTRAGTTVPGGDVLQQAIDANLDALAQEIENWLSSQLGL